MPYDFYVYMLIIISIIIAVIAQVRVSVTYSKYSNVRSESGITGAMAADRLLRSRGIYDVNIQLVPGKLTDHYDPRNKTLNLSESVYNSNSVAAIGVAAHECGHAIQHSEEYAPLKFRTALVPYANIGTRYSWFLILAGIMFGLGDVVVPIGILLFSAAVLFHLVTLPVEFDASKRALLLLDENGVLYGKELKKSRKVLSAAAMTYVAAAATAVLQLLRLILIFGGRRRD